MKDRLTQFDLLPHAPKPRGKAAIKAKATAFRHAVTSLPQYGACKRVIGGTWRQITADIRFAFLRFWAQFSPFAARLLRQIWAWFLQTKLVREVRDWAHRFNTALHALPQYQFLARVHRFFNAKPIYRFLFYLALMTAIELPICISSPNPSHEAYIYLVVDRLGPEVVWDYPTEDRELPLLTISSDTAASDSQLILHKDLPVTILHGDQRITVNSRRETVAHLLRRLYINVGEKEMVAVNVSGSAPLIHISEELRYERNEQTLSPYNTRTYSNYLLEKGSYYVIQEGQPGCITNTYEDVYRLGEVVESHLIARSDDSAVTQIVEYGHLAHSMEQDVHAIKDHPFLDGSGGGYLIFENGDSMIYTKKVINNATAYYGGTITATGHPVGIGVIAVDPKVYSYHTSMYIGSVSGGSYYGIGTAYDCGGAVKGNIIDLWYPTYADCARWGRRDVVCYILQDRNLS